MRVGCGEVLCGRGESVTLRAVGGGLAGAGGIVKAAGGGAGRRVGRAEVVQIVVHTEGAARA